MSKREKIPNHKFQIPNKFQYPKIETFVVAWDATNIKKRGPRPKPGTDAELLLARACVCELHAQGAQEGGKR